MVNIEIFAPNDFFVDNTTNNIILVETFYVQRIVLQWSCIQSFLGSGITLYVDDRLDVLNRICNL